MGVTITINMRDAGPLFLLLATIVFSSAQGPEFAIAESEAVEALADARYEVDAAWVQSPETTAAEEVQAVDKITQSLPPPDLASKQGRRTSELLQQTAAASHAGTTRQDVKKIWHHVVQIFDRKKTHMSRNVRRLDSVQTGYGKPKATKAKTTTKKTTKKKSKKKTAKKKKESKKMAKKTHLKKTVNKKK